MTEITPALDTALTELGNDLQKAIGEGNASRGFHEEGDRLRRSTHPSFESVELSEQQQAQANLRNYYFTKLGLITTEVAEAMEELRHGKAADEQYESDGGKPEGVPSEIADIVIRCFDFADEAGFSLIEVILNKLTYNSSRGFRHGNKAV